MDDVAPAAAAAAASIVAVSFVTATAAVDLCSVISDTEKEGGTEGGIREGGCLAF